VGWFQSLFRTSTAAEDLPLSSRMLSMETDMLAVHAQLDAMHTMLRKLQGKVYRGVSLGETVDAAKPPGEPGMEAGNLVQEVAVSKSDLYKRAAQLRGR